MKVSAGLLMYVRAGSGPLQVLLAHPGGPYWRKKDRGAWTIPKGLPEAGEGELDAALREFEEETGLRAQQPFIALTPIRQKSGKLVRCWAFEGDARAALAPGASRFEIEWPPHSGQRTSFPEVDDVRLFEIEDALTKIVPGQAGFVRELAALVG
jgi:predicted NUDIX family NTP pyrophosphohydrolase